MMTRIWRNGVRLALALAVAAVLVPVVSAEAQVIRIVGSDTRNTVNFNVGYFALRGEDSRVEEDVLLANLRAGRGALLFDISDFNSGTFGGEWLYGVSDYLEAGVGVNFYQRSVPSVYAELIDSDGTEIAQDLKLRILPITATVRFLPAGRHGSVVPYIGAGVGFFNWRYSETGEFVDLFDDTIFRASYSASGNAVGPVVLGGLRAPVGDAWTFGGEVRWQRAEGDTDIAVSELLGERITSAA